VLWFVCYQPFAHLAFPVEGLQITAAETPMPKAPTTKKKGKRSGPRQRQVRITNTHLKGEIDLSRNYSAPPK
jgi:transcription initiation factor TFIIE subunit beta